MPASYTNEGFLFINNNVTDNTPFITGRIIDSDDELICPGEIMPHINPETYTDILYYTPIVRGTRVRIYWYNTYWHISTVNQIYLSLYDKLLNEQVNTDLLDQDNVYYAVILEDCIMLTYVTEKKAPTLHIPQLEHDLAFSHHMQLSPFDNDKDKSNLQKMIKTLQIEKEYNADYGLTLFKQDGTQIEIWSKQYYLIKSMEKPDNVSIYNYYFYCLNTYCITTEEYDDFEIVMIRLLCDINEFTIYFPEHKEKCASITKKIEEYILDDSNKHILNMLLV